MQVTALFNFNKATHNNICKNIPLGIFLWRIDIAGHLIKFYMKQKLVFALIMGLITTAIISFVLVAVNMGFGHRFLTAWLRSWSIAYVLAVSSMLLIAPRIQLFVTKLFSPDLPVVKR